jgi:long-chain acyl-CoA synthetase
MVYYEHLKLGGLCLAAAARYGRRKAFEAYRDGKVYNMVSYEEWGNRSRSMGDLLSSLGVKAGDRVMILAENRPQWPIAFFGAALAGAVIVPVPADFLPGRIKAIGEREGIRALCLSSRTAPKAAGLDAALPRIFLDRMEYPPPVQKGADAEGTIPVSIQGLAKSMCLRKPGREKPELLPGGEDDPAAVFYAAQTGGGLNRSHRELIRSAAAPVKLYPRDRFVSTISLAEIHECTLGLLGALINGASVSYMEIPPSPEELIPAKQTQRPTVMITGSDFIETMYHKKIVPALKASLLYRFPPARPLALWRAGRRLTSAFGGLIRFLGICGRPQADVENFLRAVKFPSLRADPGTGLLPGD